MWNLLIKSSFRCSTLAIVMLLLLTLAIHLQETTAKPYGPWPAPITTGCDLDVGIDTLCQRCAKHTKSRIVYPMCCQNAEEAQTWCIEYLGFGSQ